MSKNLVVILFALAFGVGARLYRKYRMNGAGKNEIGKKPQGTGFPDSLKDEEYEPYSKK